MDKYNLTKDEAFGIAQLIDETLFDTIRNDVDIDSMTWLRNVVHGYEKLCRFSGYIGLTEDKYAEDKDEEA